MITDLETEQYPRESGWDVCIVGSGAAGLALAERLSARGKRVALLESGGKLPDSKGDDLNAGEFIDQRFSGLVDGRARALGGSTRRWYGQCIRYRPIDFSKRSWIPNSGWPITYEEMDQAYGEAETFFDLVGQVYDSQNFQRLGLDPPDFNPELLRVHFTLFTPRVDLGRLYEKRLVASGSIQCFLHATVMEIMTDKEGRTATGLVVKTPEGKHFQFRSKAVALCGGGLENARLLLLSDSISPTGLGNDQDLVGRFLQEHPNAKTATLISRRIPDLARMYSLLYQGRMRYFPKVELSPDYQRKRQTLNANAHFVFEYPEDSGVEAAKTMIRSLRHRRRPPLLKKNVACIARDLPNTMLAAQQFAVKRSAAGPGCRVRLQCYLEQEPDPESRVLLSDQRDAFGQRRISVRWKLHELEHRTMQELTCVVRREANRLGYGTLEVDDWLKHTDGGWRDEVADSFHHIGTTRMGATPHTGVVDTNCQVFGVRGLYIAGSSVFPTSGYANPTLTIVALALRLGDHLNKELNR